MDKRNVDKIRSLGVAIATERERRGMTQIDLSRMLGFTSSAHLSRIESGKKAPNLITLFAIAEILDIEVARFFSGL